MTIAEVFPSKCTALRFGIFHYLHNRFYRFRRSSPRVRRDEIDKNTLKLIHKVNPSNPNDKNLIGRESYKRNIIEIILDVLYEPQNTMKTLYRFLYKILNDFSNVVFLFLKKTQNKKRTSNTKECILLQVHDDTNYTNNSIITYLELIRNLKRNTISDIYIKPHPQDIIFAFFLRIINPFKIKLDFTSAMDLLENKTYKCFHTISSSYGACLASNNNKVLFYGINPFIGKNSQDFAKNYLKTKEELSLLIKSYIE